MTKRATVLSFLLLVFFFSNVEQVAVITVGKATQEIPIVVQDRVSILRDILVLVRDQRAHGDRILNRVIIPFADQTAHDMIVACQLASSVQDDFVILLVGNMHAIHALVAGMVVVAVVVHEIHCFLVKNKTDVGRQIF